MKYVLDACVALKWVLKEPDSPTALALREDFKRQVHEFLAPDTFLAEVGHALTRAERKKIIKPPEASVYFSDVICTVPDLRSFIPLLPRAIELSSSVRIGVYDCLYVALSEREQCLVVSADQRLVNSFPSNVVSLASF